MKWFKHISDSGDDPDIDDAITLFGYCGYYIFWRTLEVMAREFDIYNPGQNVFTLSFFKSKLRSNLGHFSEVLDFFQKKHRIYFKFFNRDGIKYIWLNCPKLKDLCDSFTERMIRESTKLVHTGVRSHFGIEEEEDIREEKNSIYDAYVLCKVPLKDGSEIEITQAKVDEYQGSYPNIDVKAEMLKLRQWNISNPARRKTRRYFWRHVNTWMNNHNKGKEVKKDDGVQYQSPSERDDLRDDRNPEEIKKAIVARDEALKKILHKL